MLHNLTFSSCDNLTGVLPMETTRLSTKGQIILPKSIREKRGWRPGTSFMVEETKEGVLLRPAPLFPPKTIDEVFGCLRYTGKPASMADMDRAIEQEIRSRHDRGRY